MIFETKDDKSHNSQHKKPKSDRKLDRDEDFKDDDRGNSWTEWAESQYHDDYVPKTYWWEY